MRKYSLAEVCPSTAKATEERDEARRAKAAADAEVVAAESTLDYWRAIHGDPVRAARERKDPGEVVEQVRKAEEAEFSARVKAATRTNERDLAERKVWSCAEGASEILGAQARKDLAEIQGRFDMHRAGMQQAAAEEEALLSAVTGALTQYFGYARNAGHLGCALRSAVG